MTRRVLVINDDAGVPETIRQTLGDRGYEVITASNGALGLAEFRGAGRSRESRYYLCGCFRGMDWASGESESVYSPMRDHSRFRQVSNGDEKEEAGPARSPTLLLRRLPLMADKIGKFSRQNRDIRI
jgi:hypothetical protein